jgi:hypothetical protein
MNSNATVRSKVGSAPSPRAASRPGPAASGMTPGWFYLFGYGSLTLSPLVGWSRDLPQRQDAPRARDTRRRRRAAACADRGRSLTRFSSLFQSKVGPSRGRHPWRPGACGSCQVAPTRPHFAKVPRLGHPLHENGRGTLVSALAAVSAVAVCRSQPLPQLVDPLWLPAAKRPTVRDRRRLLALAELAL